MDSEFIQSIVEQQAPDAKYYRNYLNDVLPGSAGPERQMPLIPPSIKQDALKNWMKTRGFSQAKKKSNTTTTQLSHYEAEGGLVEQQDTILPAEAAFNKSTPEQRAAYMKKYGTPYPPPDTSRRAGGGSNQAPAWMRGGFQSRAEYDKLDPETKSLLEP